MKFKEKKEPLIRVVSSFPGLSSIPEIAPKPSNLYLPEWWKKTALKSKMQKGLMVEVGNVKNCPSFPDYFSQGIIIPMWVDSIISFDKTTGEWAWRTPHGKFTWSSHSSSQFLDVVSHHYLNKKATFVFKTDCPWRIITSKGYSVYQLPLFYHQENDFSVLPGIIDTDYYHQINQQVLFHTDKTEIFIKKGTPFVQYIPFKREQISLKVSDANEEEAIFFRNQDLRFQTSFGGSKDYLKLRKENNE